MGDDNVFVYMGEGGARVPDNVVNARVYPTSNRHCHGDSRESIFQEGQVKKAELCEGPHEIGEQAFKENKTPSTVTAI